MRIIVCGGRDYRNASRIFGILDAYILRPAEVTIVHGAAHGADSLAGVWARSRGQSEERHPANWRPLGRSGPVDKTAGFRRNEDMAILGADLCIAFPGGNGTADMVRRARAHSIPVRLIEDNRS